MSTYRLLCVLMWLLLPLSVTHSGIAVTPSLSKVLTIILTNVNNNYLDDINSYTLYPIQQLVTTTPHRMF